MEYAIVLRMGRDLWTLYVSTVRFKARRVITKDRYLTKQQFVIVVKYVFTPPVFTIFGATFVLFDFTLWFSYLTFVCYTTIMCLLSQILICWILLFIFMNSTLLRRTYNVIYDNQFNSVIDKVNPMSLNSRIGAPSFDLSEYLCFLRKHA